MLKNKTILLISTLMILSIYLLMILSLNNKLQHTQLQNTITGKATNVNGNVGVCVQGNNTYSASFANPHYHSIINGTINSSIYFSWRDPNEIYNVTFTARNIQTKQSWYLGEQQVPLDTNTAIQEVNTTKMPDGNCVYEFQADIKGTKSCLLMKYVNGVSVNNYNLPPIYSDYNGSNTTNFTKYPYTAVPNATLEKPGIGEIEWYNETLNFENANLNKYITLKDKEVSVANDHLYCLRDQTVDVTFYNVTYFRPGMTENGKDCISSQKCQLLYYNKTSHTAKFRINTFDGTYHVIENTKGVLNIWYETCCGAENVTMNNPFYVYANYTAAVGNVTYYIGTLSGVYCNLSYAYQTQDNYSWPILMPYSQNIDLYSYTLSFENAGLYFIKVSCDADSHDLGKALKVITVQVIPMIPHVNTWCTTDLDSGNGEPYVRYIHQPVDFWINMTYMGHNLPILNATCNISFVDNFKNITLPAWYNDTSGYYQTNYSFQTPGIRNYSVSCSKLPNIAQRYVNGTVDIRNRPPIYLGNINPNQMIPGSKWPQDTAISPYYLNDYFIDPDGNKLTYTVEPGTNHIQVVIANDSKVTYIPEAGYSGIQYIIFKASDGYGGYAYTQRIVLDVVKLPQESPNNQEGSENKQNQPENTNNMIALNGLNQNPTTPRTCIEKWVCSNWSKCYPSGIQTRTCTDLNKCNTTEKKPAQSQKCTYIPTCYDHIKNGGETGVDCGGPCPPCPSCHDGIKNEGETGIDCGGPCQPCPSCYDGIKNEGETGIDCGGPCPPCQKIIAPEIFKTKIENNLIPISTLITLVVIGLIIYLRYHQAIIDALAKIWLLLLAYYLTKIRHKENLEEEINLSQYLEIRISSLKRNLNKLSEERLLNETLKMTRLLLKKIFRINYEFTEEDLKKSMNKIPLSNSKKKIFIAFFDRLVHASYSGEKINKDQLKKWLDILSYLTVITKDLLEYRILEDTIEKLRKQKKAKAKQINRKIILKLLKFIRHEKDNLKQKNLKAAIEENYIIENTLNMVNQSKIKINKLNKIKLKIKELSTQLKNELNNTKNES
ncbi:MAG: hypothetical protein GWP09_01180 [Nitrospiraceae bacterium]|nr:hypothetical protein [Nitrospiraceae bacterium]